MSKYSMADYAAKAREAVAEGIVLLRNENGVLPLAAGTRVAVFGRSQFNYYKSGTGSGGLVNTAYVTGILDALEADEDLEVDQGVKAIYEEWLKEHPFDAGSGWASEPWHQEEMPLAAWMLRQARESTDTAIVVIGRTAGEDQDNKAEAGSYYLTDTEEEMIELVCDAFDRTIVLLNVGNIIDMRWVRRYGPSAVAYVWQGGQEGGNGVLDVLKGTVNPSGKLPDTIPWNINDIPSTAGFGDPHKAVYSEDIYVGYRYFETFAKDQVQYPFGFGLSYTTFSMETTNLRTETMTRKGVTVTVKVKNTGDVPGKEVVQVYAAAPQGKLGKAARSLCGFAKTKLLVPGESQEIVIGVPAYALASYDDAGVTGHKSAYVLEAGTYDFYVGSDVRSAVKAGSAQLKRLTVIEQLTEAMAPIEEFNVIHPLEETSADGEETTCSVQLVPVSTATVDVQQRIQEHLPKTLRRTGDKGYKLSDVADGKITMEEFILQFSDEDLTALVRGEGMCSPKVTPGIAGAIGGVTEHLQHFGLPVAGVSDGPSGIRMDCGTLAFAMPNGTLLASTFNEELSTELYEWEGLELRKNKIDSLLGPGMNIHRNPLNGRNFEYFSEDPLLTGKMAAAQLRGMHKYNVTGTIKHFACNNQETNRHGVEAVVSERALREIYLKGFEIAVKEGGAYSIMTSYNPVNGYWTASNYDLLTTILRGEWGYTGIVMTDWWAKGNFLPGEKGELINTAAKARAQNDLNMVNPDASDKKCDNALEAMKAKKVTRGEYQRCAMNICNYLLRTPAFDRMLHGDSKLDQDLSDFRFEGGEVVTKTLEWAIGDEGKGSLDGKLLDNTKGGLNLISTSVKERGIYELSITCRASAGEEEVAQIPVTVFRDKDLVGTVTITGADKKWKTYKIENLPPVFNNSFYLKLYFAQGGMEVKEVTMKMTVSMEEKIKEAMAAMSQ